MLCSTPRDSDSLIGARPRHGHFFSQIFPGDSNIQLKMRTTALAENPMCVPWSSELLLYPKAKRLHRDLLLACMRRENRRRGWLTELTDSPLRAQVYRHSCPQTTWFIPRFIMSWALTVRILEKSFLLDTRVQVIPHFFIFKSFCEWLSHIFPCQ